MAITLYDLTATGDRRFSPYCWRTKLALALKGLDCEAKPVRFTEIDALADGPRLTLPTVDDAGTRITDSWAIAEHLEENYAEAPSLFPSGREVARLAQAWTNTAVNPALLKVIVLDVYGELDAEDQTYFRQSREARFGMTLEAFAGDRAANLKAFRQILQPLRALLADQPYLAGASLGYGDCIPASAFLWAEAVGQGDDLLDAGDPIGPWLSRVTGILGGDG